MLNDDREAWVNLAAEFRNRAAVRFNMQPLEMIVVVQLALLQVATPAGEPGRIVEDSQLHQQFEEIRRHNPRKIEFYEQILLLKETARTLGLRHVVEQAALYSSRRDDGWKTSNFKFFRRVTWQLVEIGDGPHSYFVIKTLVPHLASDDERLRGFVESYLAVGTPVEEEDYHRVIVQALLDVLHERRDQPPGRIAQVLFWRAPSQALLLFASMWLEGDEDRMVSIRWSQHVIADAVWKEERFLKPQDLEAALGELDKLSRAEEWWVKLYVAEMLRRHEMFRRDDILKRLRNDPIDLVAKAADVPYYGGMTEQEYKGWRRAIPGIRVR